MWGSVWMGNSLESMRTVFNISLILWTTLGWCAARSLLTDIGFKSYGSIGWLRPWRTAFHLRIACSKPFHEIPNKKLVFLKSPRSAGSMVPSIPSGSLQVRSRSCRKSQSAKAGRWPDLPNFPGQRVIGTGRRHHTDLTWCHLVDHYCRRIRRYLLCGPLSLLKNDCVLLQIQFGKQSQDFPIPI